MGKQWDIDHRKFLLEYKRKYRVDHPEFAERERKRMVKVNMFRKEWKRLLSISL